MILSLYMYMNIQIFLFILYVNIYINQHYYNYITCILNNIYSHSWPQTSYAQKKYLGGIILTIYN